MQHRLNRAAVDMPASGIRAVAEAARHREGCIQLTLGEPGFDTPGAIRRAACQALEAGHTHYPPNAGIAPLREAIAAWEGPRYGAVLGGADALVTNGSTEAMACALAAVVEPGDEVIVPVPAFGLYAQQLALVRGRMVPLETAGSAFQLEEEALEAAVTARTKAIVINSPHNPTGVVLSRASMAAVCAVCLRHGLYLLYDAVYDQLVFDGEASRPDWGAMGGLLVVIGAFSKPYAMTGWRVGYALAAPEVLAQMVKVHAALTVGVSAFSQYGCLACFAEPIDGMLGVYRENRDLAVAALAGMGLPTVRPQGAFYAFASIARLGLDDGVFVRRAIEEAGVAVVPGECFGTPGYVRISTCVRQATLAEGLRRLGGFVAGLGSAPA